MQIAWTESLHQHQLQHRAARRREVPTPFPLGSRRMLISKIAIVGWKTRHCQKKKKNDTLGRGSSKEAMVFNTIEAMAQRPFPLEDSHGADWHTAPCAHGPPASCQACFPWVALLTDTRTSTISFPLIWSLSFSTQPPSPKYMHKVLWAAGCTAQAFLF